jgi:hypothetical protein
MIRRQTLEQTLDVLSLFGCATTAEEVQHDLDRVAAVLELRCAEARRLGHGEPAIELVTSQLLTLARRLEATSDALYAHASLAQEPTASLTRV